MENLFDLFSQPAPAVPESRPVSDEERAAKEVSVRVAEFLGVDMDRHRLYLENERVGDLHNEWAYAVGREARGTGKPEETEAKRQAYYAARDILREKILAYDCKKRGTPSDL